MLMTEDRQPHRILLIHRGVKSGDPAGHQVHGFSMYANELRSKCNIIIDQAMAENLEEVERAFRSRNNDTQTVIIMVSWAESADTICGFFQQLYEISPRPRLIFLDYYAPTCTPHFGVLPYVDTYVKRQILRDHRLYQSDYYGGFIFTDFLVKILGFNLDNWSFGSKPDPAHYHKVTHGWNLGVTAKYRTILKWTRRLDFAWRWRPIAINKRLGTAPYVKREWYQQYRDLAIQQLDPLKRRYRISGSGRISPKQYIAELACSKLVISPFGWGEVCFRDYEAVAAGALLIKPSMNHLLTSPNIYKPHETYVPVRWDLNDLAEICEYYLTHPRHAMEIIQHAQRELSRYYEDGGFLADVERILQRQQIVEN